MHLFLPAIVVARLIAYSSPLCISFNFLKDLKIENKSHLLSYADGYYYINFPYVNVRLLLSLKINKLIKGNINANYYSKHPRAKHKKLI